ncbi:luciferase [Wenjunlia vitaminophila]|uniref:Luciferase n=1 Tax=Wenjunlia vitaminophila TaxID=76728 RepID=A0A0T6LW61_WENVI|nr:LLM class F420-dependent oxidoreductase [Wenjunlia vitaminophila]KRV49967.1 luciferase [Wenjunlia vitaminophila]
MTSFGYFLSSETSTPRDLLEQARMAEQAGFEALWISDHYHPWTRTQGESPFVWSVIGGLSQVTSLPVETAVTCPTVRTHPAVVAQAAATCGVMLEGSFRLGIGSGEALNEHVVGGPWPPASMRLEMVEEAVTVIRRLFSGEEVTHHGKHYTVENAQLHTLPEEPVPIDISGLGSSAVALAGRIGDGLITMAPDADLVARYRKSGGKGKPVHGGTKVCWGTDRDEAVRTAHRIWPNDHLPGELPQVLPTPQHIEQACTMVTEETVAESVVCGDDVDEHLAWLQSFTDAGFDTVYINQIGPDHRGFFDFYRTKILPQLTL